jgi:hypothetical protein
MRFKLDENLSTHLVPLLSEGGSDVETVAGEGLSGQPDHDIFEVCCSEGSRFPPGETEGIVVLRPPRPVLSLIRITLESALPVLRSNPLRGKLWIVEPGRIRVYDPGDHETA